MTPFLFLVLALGVTVIAAAMQFAQRHHRVVQLRALATQSNLHYCANDRFQLAPRLAGRIDCPGAADVSVADVIYGLKDDRFRYVFTAEYTRGALRHKKRVRRVLAVSEPKTRSLRDSDLHITTAPDSSPLLSQYRELIGAA